MKNKMLQRIINIALAVTLVVGIVPVNAMADEIEADTAIEYAEETDVEEDVSEEATAVKSAKIGTYCKVAQRNYYMLPNGNGGWGNYNALLENMIFKPIGIPQKELDECKTKRAKSYWKTVDDWCEKAKLVKVSVANPDRYIDIEKSLNWKNAWSFKTWEMGNYSNKKYTVYSTYKFNGKKYTFTSTVSVLAEQPFSMIKLNTKDITKDAKWALNCYKGTENKNYRLTWKMKKGYKVLNVQYAAIKKNSYRAPNLPYKMGKNIKFKNLSDIYYTFTIQDPKGRTFEYMVCVSSYQ